LVVRETESPEAVKTSSRLKSLGVTQTSSKDVEVEGHTAGQKYKLKEISLQFESNSLFSFDSISNLRAPRRWSFTAEVFENDDILERGLEHERGNAECIMSISKPLGKLKLDSKHVVSLEEHAESQFIELLEDVLGQLEHLDTFYIQSEDFQNFTFKKPTTRGYRKLPKLSVISLKDAVVFGKDGKIKGVVEETGLTTEDSGTVTGILLIVRREDENELQHLKRK
jgi:hypothetical protein